MKRLAMIAMAGLVALSACTTEQDDPTKGVTALPSDAAGIQASFEDLAHDRGYDQISSVHVDPDQGIEVSLLADGATEDGHVVTLSWPAGEISEQDGALAEPVPTIPVTDDIPIGDLYTQALDAMPDCAAVELTWSVMHNGEQLATGICDGDAQNPGFVSVGGSTVDQFGDPYTAAGVQSRLALVKSLGITSIYRFSIIEGSMPVDVADESVTLSDGTTCAWTLYLSSWVGTSCADEDGTGQSSSADASTPSEASGTQAGTPIETSTIDPAAVGSLVEQVKAAGDAAGGLGGGLITLEFDSGANQPVLRGETGTGSIVFGLDGQRLA